MSDSDCLSVIDAEGEEFQLDDIMSDLNAHELCEALKRYGECCRFVPMPEGWDDTKIVHVLDTISATVNGEVQVIGLRSDDATPQCAGVSKRWKFVRVGDGIVFTLGVNDLVIIRDTGDRENAIEGGYTSVYEVLYSDVSEDKGKLTYDTLSFGSVALGNYQSNLGVTASPQPSGSHEYHINDMGTVRDEDLDELRDRDVRVIMAPCRNHPIHQMFCSWSA